MIQGGAHPDARNREPFPFGANDIDAVVLSNAHIDHAVASCELGTHHAEWELDHWRLFLDSPMAIDALQVYQQHHDLYDDEAREVRERAGRCRRCQTSSYAGQWRNRWAINRHEIGVIIIAGSGMCNGGHIVHDLKPNLPRPECIDLALGA